MKSMKRILGLVLAALLLLSLPLSAAAHEAPDLTKADVSDPEKYPIISFGGGFHPLYVDDESGQPRAVFDTEAMGPALDTGIPAMGGAITKLDLNGFVDALKGVVEDVFGEARMDEDGESILPGVHANITPEWTNPELRYMYDDEYIRQKVVTWGCDWRLDPLENAVKAREYMRWIKTQRPEVEKFNLVAFSGTCSVLLAYLHLFPEDIGTEVASVVFQVSTHRGTTMFGQMAKGDYWIDARALGQTRGIGFFYMDLTSLHPLLRFAYETGMLDALLTVGALMQIPIKGRMYDEIITPALFHMPGMWIYVPRKDFAQAKSFLFKGSGKYAKLADKLDGYYEMSLHDEALIQHAAEHVKVGVRAGYGFCMTPVGAGTDVQGDYVVDTRYASLGATCAPMGTPFKRNYQQLEPGEGGRSYVSPDRLVDASTCLLPDRTWFAKYRLHDDPDTYGGWIDWFLETDEPNVFGSADFPQFAERLDADVYVPVEAPTPLEEAGIALDSAVSRAMALLRRVLLLPLFWTKWVL
ncbi:MAG: hypothetical protein FWE98_07875 [Oscillospiraceae bacterium]|nr:hypothetical protein [Oscillospiraceae bacterium]